MIFALNISRKHDHNEMARYFVKSKFGTNEYLGDGSLICRNAEKYVFYKHDYQ